jgi:tubulin beta
MDDGATDRNRARVDVFFNEMSSGHYNARTILADLEPGSIDTARASTVGKLYNPDNFVIGLGSAGSNWAVGYYGKGHDLIETLMDKVRC